MQKLFRIQEFLARIVIGVGKLSAWLSIPLMVVIIFDVVTRRFLVLGSTKLQEAEWHLHAVLFLLCIGFTYIEDAHVRIDLLRERLSTRAKDWVELIGCIIFVIPYCLIVTYFAEDFVERSWAVGEASDSATGLPYRWAIKAGLPIGLFVLLLSGITVLLRKIIELFGPADLRELLPRKEERASEPIDRLGQS
jgi:TRAP-type mannitol/chloroaromatic compound transport system permease small subunit